MERYVGLDTHSKSSVYVIQDKDGRIVGEGTVETTAQGLAQLRDIQALPPRTPVALESGTVAFFVAERLADLGLKPVVIDAREVRVKASRPFQKSDSRDALELCEGLRRGYYRSLVTVPPSAIRELRESLSRRRHFVRLKTAEVNAVKRLLRGAGLTTHLRSLQTSSGWSKLIVGLGDAPRLQRFAECHRQAWAIAHLQVLALEVEIKDLCGAWKTEMENLMTVPGVGPLVAATFLAVIFDARRFPSAKHVGSYAGLVPRTDQSGERMHNGHIIRRGSGELRSMLCEAAQHARRVGNPLNPYFTRIAGRRGYRMAIVAVAHRLCRILYAIQRDQSTFCLEKAGVEAGLFQKTSVRRYRCLATTNV